MEQRKPWQFYLIVAVVILTLVNVLPTVIYYAKPLREPVGRERAMHVAHGIVERVNRLQPEAVSWLQAFTKHIGTKPDSIAVAEDDPQLIAVTFNNSADTEKFKRLLNDAGASIPFVPAQLGLSARLSDNPLQTVYVQRRLSTQFDPNNVEEYFTYGSKFDDAGNPSTAYRELVYDRVTQIALSLGGPSEQAQVLSSLKDRPYGPNQRQNILAFAKEIVETAQVLGEDSSILRRQFASYTQTDQVSASALVTDLASKFEQARTGLQTERERLDKQQQELADDGQFLDSEAQQQLKALHQREAYVNEALRLVRQHADWFESDVQGLTERDMASRLARSELDGSDIQRVEIGDQSPVVESLSIDWSNDQILLTLHPDIVGVLSASPESEQGAREQDFVRKQVFEAIAQAAQETEEDIQPHGLEFATQLDILNGSRSFLALELSAVAKSEAARIAQIIRKQWKPQHPELQAQNFPVYDWESFQSLSPIERKLGLVVYAPAADRDTPPNGFSRMGVYVIARGLPTILDKYDRDPNGEAVQQLRQDGAALNDLLSKQGLQEFVTQLNVVDENFRQDAIWRKPAYQNLLAATRENFHVRGAQQRAILEFTDVEQRINVLNKIENAEHEDLLKWQELYDNAQVSMDSRSRLLAPPPNRNVYWENLKLNWRKYFRGDESNILKWGLDLQGGKTVRLELRNENNQVVTNPEELQQAVDELYTRINKLGVSEQTIRIENDKIVLEFPGSQGLTAADLIQASAMYLHIVNEKFSVNPQHSLGDQTLVNATDRFLRGVWNEAVVTNRMDETDINEIAWRHLGGDATEIGDADNFVPRTDDAKLLVENGLRLANPEGTPASTRFDETLSRVAVRRGEDPTEWRHNHPLMIVFHNYALEGASLSDINPNYDASEGHFLNFSVANSYANRDGSPRDDFYAWTSQFSRDATVNTAKQIQGANAGWRLAVVLNGRVVSDPSLTASLREGGRISGGFTQRQINRLAADLKAGSLTYTPRVLSETNVSPDLGKEERARGIASAVMGLVFVVIAMVTCYRFAGVIASFAVLTNLFILWGVLQNLDAALTLPGIAGIILTVGMAVDANVLVFERIREEFKVSGRLSSAISAGYRKAFSAIIDSNLTTIIAAMILIQFDAGPIKGFAVTLAIGIASSMFTALFMTRYFFTGWVQKTKATALEMREIFKPSSFNFLKRAKYMASVSLVIMVVGGALIYTQANTILGMEFTGGYSLTLELDEESSESYRSDAVDALLSAGANVSDFQVKRLNKPNQLSIQFGQGMEEADRPFHEMPMELPEGDYTYAYEQNPRITWTVDSLASAGLTVKEGQLERLEQSWSVMSGQFSNAMRNNAIMALSAAMLCILLYITVRFEWKYAISAIIALAHDVAVTLSILGILHLLGLPVQLDMEVLGAMIAIIGYSLNDTIIIFDRIREDIRIHRKMSFEEVVNHAINVTLSRTIMTSATTLLVLLPLVILGGSAILGFALVMTIGVVFGTLSSLFIAAPTMLFFHKREETRHHERSMALNGA